VGLNLSDLRTNDSQNHWKLCATFPVSLTNHAVFTLKLQLPLFSSGKEIERESGRLALLWLYHSNTKKDNRNFGLI
jgi:hypothetical protein